jgi:anaerobic selenocysteine-containing dehydrogenase
MPDFMSKLTWDNAVLVSPATADELGVTHGDVVDVMLGERSVQLSRGEDLAILESMAVIYENAGQPEVSVFRPFIESMWNNDPERWGDMGASGG